MLIADRAEPRAAWMNFHEQAVAAKEPDEGNFEEKYYYIRDAQGRFSKNLDIDPQEFKQVRILFKS